MEIVYDGILINEASCKSKDKILENLFNLKKWLTLNETAKYLTIVFGEDVSEAQVLRFALDGHFKLSLNFVNSATAIECKVISIEDASYIPLDILQLITITEEFKVELNQFMRDIQLNDKQVITLTEKVIELEGVFDLAMIGNERIDIEQKYQSLTGGPEVTQLGVEGVFVTNKDNIFYKIHERCDDNKNIANSSALYYELVKIIKNNNTNPLEFIKLLEQNVDMKNFLARAKENRNTGNDTINYYPALCIPDDCAIVVRTEALKEFVHSINEEPASTDKLMTAKERNTLLIIIAALCDYSDINPQARGTAKQIADLTSEFGAPVTDDTIRLIIKKMSDAVELRKIEKLNLISSISKKIIIE